MKSPIAILVTSFGLTLASNAQNYSIDWFTIDAGGGTSAGGMYALSGTIGQPDAGKHGGGTYALDGGFWGVLQTAGAPLLSIVKTNGMATVFWLKPADGFVLDRTSALTAPPAAIAWSQVGFPYQTNATHIFITVPVAAGNQFYRLRKN